MAAVWTNITGRNYFPWNKKGPLVDKIIALSIHPKADGDAIGVGNADIITKRLKDSLNIDRMYTTGITAKSLKGCKIPFTAKNDLEAISIGLYCVIGKKPEEAKVVRIKNTLDIHTIEISRALVEDIKENVLFTGDYFTWEFNKDGNLF